MLPRASERDLLIEGSSACKNADCILFVGLSNRLQRKHRCSIINISMRQLIRQVKETHDPSILEPEELTDDAPRFALALGMSQAIVWVL